MRSVYVRLFLFLAVVCLAGCQSSGTPKSESSAKQTFTVETFTASEAGFSVSSYLILGKKNAVLIDGQFLRSEAKKLAEKIKASGKNLTTIFVTHGHPDHYFGLEILQKEFPSAKVLASEKVVSDIKDTAGAKLDYWKKKYKDDLTDKYIVPEVLTDKEIDLEGEKLKILEFAAGESAHSNVVYLPAQKLLFAGDLVFNQVHLWLAENHAEAWQATLKQLKEMPVETVYPGHGGPGTPALFDENYRYIETFVHATSGKTTRKRALKKITTAYPKFKLPVIAELSVASRVKN
jgi:glyoxylase-like metal-dependent hydrolase (beta-lactamase superfamily II)